MTTITIKKNIDLKKTIFEDVEDLLEALQQISPLKLYQEDQTNFPTSTREKVKFSKNNPNRKLTDFKG